MRNLGYLGITSIAIMADQWIKYYMRTILDSSVLSTGKMLVFNVLGFHFDLDLAFNKGVSFSLMSNNNQTPIILMSLLLIFILFIWLRRSEGKITSFGLALLLGGAIGNVIDRVVHGGVVDFLRFYIKTSDSVYAFPTFNIADILITCGVVCILWQDIFAKSGKKG